MNLMIINSYQDLNDYHMTKERIMLEFHETYICCVYVRMYRFFLVFISGIIMIVKTQINWNDSK